MFQVIIDLVWCKNQPFQPVDKQGPGVESWIKAELVRYRRMFCNLSDSSHQHMTRHVVAGYGTDVDLDVIRAWWSLRSLRAIRWLVEHSFDPSPEIAVLRSRT